MSWLTDNDPIPGDCRSCDAIEQIIVPRARDLGGFSVRQGINAGAALVAHGEFTIILAQLAAGNAVLSAEHRDDIVAFAGLYVLASATIGVVLMKESKRLGRFLRPAGALE